MKKTEWLVGLFFGDEILPSYIEIFNTPPKTNMEPTNEGLEDVSPFQMGDFQVPC